MSRLSNGAPVGTPLISKATSIKGSKVVSEVTVFDKCYEGLCQGQYKVVKCVSDLHPLTAKNPFAFSSKFACILTIL